MAVHISPESPLRVLKEYRKKLKHRGLRFIHEIRILNKWIRKKQHDHMIKVNVEANKRLLKALEKDTENAK